MIESRRLLSDRVRPICVLNDMIILPGAQQPPSVNAPIFALFQSRRVGLLDIASICVCRHARLFLVVSFGHESRRRRSWRDGGESKL